MTLLLRFHCDKCDRNFETEIGQLYVPTDVIEDPSQTYINYCPICHGKCKTTSAAWIDSLEGVAIG